MRTADRAPYSVGSTAAAWAAAQIRTAFSAMPASAGGTSIRATSSSVRRSSEAAATACSMPAV